MTIETAFVRYSNFGRYLGENRYKNDYYVRLEQFVKQTVKEMCDELGTITTLICAISLGADKESLIRLGFNKHDVNLTLIFCGESVEDDD